MREDLSQRDNWQAKASLGGLGREELAKKILETYLREDERYLLDPRPTYLAKIYEDSWGVIPDFAIRSLVTSKIAFVETKRQGINGNAHERACKYFAPGLQKIFEEVGGFPRPIFTIFMDGLTTDTKKILEISSWYNTPEWQDRYLLWKNRDVDLLINYWKTVMEPYISSEKQ